MSQFIEMFGGGNWPQKTLGEVGSFTRGGGFQKSDFVEHGIPCIHYGQIHTKFGPFITSHITEISSDLESKTKFASKGDLVIAITSEDTEGSCKSTAWLGDYSVAVGGHAAIYKHSMNPLYMSFFFKSTLFNHAKIEYVHGTKVFEIKPDDIAKILVPCPPMSLQNQFSAIAEQADKSGFDGFKSQFIEMFKNEKMVPLGKFCSIEKGSTITRNEVSPGDIPVVAGGQEASCYHNVSNREAGMITVSASGAYAGFVNYWTCPIFASDCNTISPKEKNAIDTIFLFYGMKALQKHIYGLQKGGAQPHVYGKDLQNLLFPLPTIDKQSSFSRIAQQADKSGVELRKSIDAIDKVIKSLINENL